MNRLRNTWKTMGRGTLCCALLSGIHALPLNASTVGWTGGSNSWSGSTNWDSGSLPAAGDTIQIGSTAANAPQTIDLGPGTRTINQILGVNNTGARSLALNSGTLVLQRTSGGTNPLIWFNQTGTGLQSITINSDILVDAATPADDASLLIGSTNAANKGNADQTIALNGTISGSVGGGTRKLVKYSDSVLLIAGYNDLTNNELRGGEIIAANAHALGNGQLTVSTGILSLRGADVSLAGNSTSITSTGTLTLRLNESGANDRMLTLAGRLASSNAAAAIVIGPNAGGSTGNFILNLGYSTTSATVGNNAKLVTSAGSIVRFSNAADNAPYVQNNYGTAGISGGGNVEIIGGGRTIFSVGMTYTGSTTISNGTLLLSGDGSLAGTSTLFVDSSGTFAITNITASSYTLTSDQTLAGTGAVVATGKTLVLSGALAPGDLTGTTTGALSATGSFTLDAGSVSNFELMGTTGGLFDSLAVSGTLTLGGTLNLLTGYAAQAGDEIDILDWTSLSGTFESITGTDIGGGLSWDVSQLYTRGTITAVPEPGPVGLCLLAGLVVCARWRRRKTAA